MEATRVERSILFSPAMARVILKGKKTVTRRVITAHSATQCPYGPAGTRLWLKEDFYAYGRWEPVFDALQARYAWHFLDLTTESGQDYQFYAPQAHTPAAYDPAQPLWWWRPGRYMPRQASRIFLEVTGIDTEHLHDITDEQAEAEGFYPLHDSVQVYFANHLPAPHIGMSPTAVIAFATYWQSRHRPGSWDSNPLVWVIRFRRMTHQPALPAA